MSDPEILVTTGEEPLDAGSAVEWVSSPSAGGTAVFLGSVRSPNEGQEVDHLSYEMWDEKVQAALRDIARQALARFGATRAYVAHRSGRVEVGEPSVVVAVSAPHRAEAFDACRFVIDTLKQSAPIWKREVGESTDRWVGLPAEGEQR
jgi:molybdopterin synthase catalytic subunit